MNKTNYIRVLDYMADLYHAEFTFASCDEDQQNEIIHKFINTPKFFEMEAEKYYENNSNHNAEDLNNIEVEAEEVKPSNVEILQNLINYNRYDG
tara:strand:+ start:1334 stop:1615 length:282 start_codon:yes stop_codon:yes gene_type:complete